VLPNPVSHLAPNYMNLTQAVLCCGTGGRGRPVSAPAPSDRVGQFVEGQLPGQSVAPMVGRTVRKVEEADIDAVPGSERWLTRNLKIVSGVSFLQDAASELLYPILPIFLTVTLGAPAAVVGVVEGLAEGAASVTKVAAGRLSDRYPRRRLIATGYGLAALGKVLVAVAWAWPAVLAGRCVDRLGKGVRGAPRDALIAADVPPEARGRAFGFHRAMDTAGAVVGPLIGWPATNCWRSNCGRCW
jgi:hypothetical protein